MNSMRQVHLISTIPVLLYAFTIKYLRIENYNTIIWSQEPQKPRTKCTSTKHLPNKKKKLSTHCPNSPHYNYIHTISISTFALHLRKAKRWSHEKKTASTKSERKKIISNYTISFKIIHHACARAADKPNKRRVWAWRAHWTWEAARVDDLIA